ncbi:hypothetical protein B0181_00875 [Moraxella caviae]|uniref:UDP-2,3-diacylglucosamine hydrolase n=1 Tax=Moraxella caviae TaxID=34060 RepID=A0A1T0ABF7_9GAMM|nr:metallophosphoesterase [Moraxella caviae]OOR93066.1 hypothetical protein B0181_00875 [Moraxella caviae]STZ10041.1 UDP-2,3-diacylglucosamine hydrolase [Moraxella caviae]VEW12768.1 UDP-2,3-diacylglucosamine hydrolase [Moraxella caviae]
MLNFSHICTTKPHEIRAVFVADLHLSERTPRLMAAFLALIKDLEKLPNLERFFIAGDWLDGWIGDDDYLHLNADEKRAHWLTPALGALDNLHKKDVQIFIMHGNRDFALRQTLCDIFGGALIDEPYCFTENFDAEFSESGFDESYDLTQHSHQKHSRQQLITKTIRFRLEHGDKLCTDDARYQRYRKIIRNPVISWLLLHTPLSYRRKLAANIKAQSAQDKRQKSHAIMDVNAAAVRAALDGCDVLIHGHTHRPQSHVLQDLPNKKRLVLGDWRTDGDKVCAVIGVLSDEMRLYEFVWG